MHCRCHSLKLGFGNKEETLQKKNLTRCKKKNMISPVGPDGGAVITRDWFAVDNLQ